LTTQQIDFLRSLEISVANGGDVCDECTDWDVSDNNRKAKYYKLTRAGRKRLAQETQKWEITTEILGRFFTPLEEP